MPKDNDEKKTYQILPLRLKRSDVKTIDAAYKRLGYPSRAKFLTDAVESLIRAKGDKAADRLSWATRGGDETSPTPSNTPSETTAEAAA